MVLNNSEYVLFIEGAKIYDESVILDEGSVIRSISLHVEEDTYSFCMFFSKNMEEHTAMLHSRAEINYFIIHCSSYT